MDAGFVVCIINVQQFVYCAQITNLFDISNIFQSLFWS